MHLTLSKGTTKTANNGLKQQEKNEVDLIYKPIYFILLV